MIMFSPVVCSCACLQGYIRIPFAYLLDASDCEETNKSQLLTASQEQQLHSSKSTGTSWDLLFFEGLQLIYAQGFCIIHLVPSVAYRALPAHSKAFFWVSFCLFLHFQILFFVPAYRTHRTYVAYHSYLCTVPTPPAQRTQGRCYSVPENEMGIAPLEHYSLSQIIYIFLI